MIVKTFDEITEHMEDSFDGFIADKTDGVKIKRTNNNVVHNVLKANGKGYELVQASCVALDSKFDPARCSEADLVSVAKIAGTAMKAGKQTVLMITAANGSAQEQSIIASGSYPAKLRFMYSADVWFEFTIPAVQTFKPGGSRQYFAWSVDPNSTEEDGSQSPLIGAYPVTAMSNIAVSGATDGTTISDGFTFSCAATDGTLGYPDETILEFRNRILEDTDRQNILKELELELNNLPTILAAKVTFNPSTSDTKPIGEPPINILPYQLLLSVNGEVTQEFGETVLSKTYLPTTQVAAPYGDELIVPSDNYTDGFVKVYYMRFRPYEYMIEITYTSDPTLQLDDMIQGQIVATMRSLYGNPSRYTKELTEDTFYDTAKGLDIDSLKVLNVNLLEYDSGWVEPTEGYIAVPASDIAKMCGVKFLYGDSQEKEIFFYRTAEPVIIFEDTECTITGEFGSTVYYTTDGTDPDDTSTEYTEPFTVSEGDTVKAIAYSPYRSGPSDIVEATA